MAVHLLERRVRVRSRREQSGPLALLRRLDVLLVASALSLTAIGLVMVYSATRGLYPLEPSYFLKRQVLYAALGVVVMVICAVIDYRRLEEWAYLLYGLVVASLLAVFVIGRSQGATVAGGGSGTAQRWISLGPLHLQPSEFGVLAVIVAIGALVARHEGALGLRALAKVGALTVVPMLLIYKQPDLGTAIVLGVVALTVLYFAGVRLRYLGFVVGAGLLGVLAVLNLHLLHSYQLQRLSCFLHPNSDPSGYCYELVQAKTAIGAGGLRGAGIFSGQVTNLGYVPVQYADFIFSAVGEQLGFVGAATVLGLFGLMALRMFRAIQRAREPLGRLLCAGAFAFLVFSVFQNVGMNIGLMPITGIPLPFISYGGSALFAFFAAVGLVINVEMRQGTR